MLTDSNSTPFRNCYEYNNKSTILMNNNCMDNLFEFLKEAQLEHYFEDFNLKLKIRLTNQLKYVDDEDLLMIGMSRPEMRRLKKYFEREFPQTAMGKIKKRLSRNTSNRSTSVPRPQDLSSRMNSFSVRANGNGPSRSPIDSDDITTIASITNFSIASNGTTESHDIRQIGSKHLILQNQLIMGSLLKHGDFADIYQGHYRCNQFQKQVCVKCFNKTHLKNDLNELIKEIFIQCSLDHQNIVKIFGVSLEDQSIKLVMEDINCNSLYQSLQDSNAKVLYPVTTLHNFSVQISEGLTYLEEKRIIHGHLTVNNILMYPDNQIKIADAGLFRNHSILDRNDSNNYEDWIAPEIVNGSHPTLSSDIWAFGVLIWEIFNYCQCPSMNNESIGHSGDLKQPRLTQPDLCPNMIFNIVTLCWNEQPRDRPTFFQLSTNFIRLVPEQLIAMSDGPDQIPSHRTEDVNEPSDGSYSSLTDMQMLCYKKGDTIIVLDRSMTVYKDFWRGCFLNGESGYFKWSNMRAMGVTPQTVISGDNSRQTNSHRNSQSPTSVRSSCRSRSVGEAFAKLRIIGRESDKKYKSGRISIDMISAPQNDFRHVGHISNNGDVFGDVTSLYTSTAQQKIRSGTISVCSKLDSSTSFSEAGSIVSSSTLNAAGDDTPPYATIDNETSKSHTNTNNHQSFKSSTNLVPPPLPPTRSYSEEETNSSSLIEDFLLPEELSLCNDGFSLFNELAKQWDVQYSQLDNEVTPTSDKKVHISETKLSLSSDCPTVVIANNECSTPQTAAHNNSIESSLIATANHKISHMSLTDKHSLTSIDISSNPVVSSSSSLSSVSKVNANSTASFSNSSSRSSSFFTKIRTFSSGKATKPKEIAISPTESVKTNPSPLYAKIKKFNKVKKEKEVTTNKRNIISNPILISAPFANSVNITDENYLDCSSEVSSLQPSPRESVLSIANQFSINNTNTNVDQGVIFNRQYSNTTNNSKNKTNGSTTSVSPASSFVSLISVPSNNIPQGGAAFRAIKKGDGVFRATAVANRRRPSAGERLSNDATLSRARQPSLPFVATMNRANTSTIDRQQYQRSGVTSNELLESVLDSSATTPIASELPDLPYIDLSFTRPPIEDKTNMGEDDDAYNSLHSGSIGSESTEPHFSIKQPGLNFENQDLQSIQEISNHQSSNNDKTHLDYPFHKTQSYLKNNNSDSLYRNFQMKSTKFANYGDSDEIAL